MIAGDSDGGHKHKIHCVYVVDFGDEFLQVGAETAPDVNSKAVAVEHFCGVCESSLCGSGAPRRPRKNGPPRRSTGFHPYVLLEGVKNALLIAARWDWLPEGVLQHPSCTCRCRRTAHHDIKGALLSLPV